jgi:hypothetical protein
LRQNKELSDDLEPALSIQGVNYLIRKLMRLATVSERISETTKPDSTKVLVVAKSAAGLSGQADTFDPSGEEHLVDGGYFGPKVRVRSWWLDQCTESVPMGVNEPLDAYLLEDWVESETEGNPRHLVGSGINDKTGVETHMMWGFCIVNGSRYRAVRYHIRRRDEVVRLRLVFSWIGKK